MTSGDAGSAPAVRLWWAAPLALLVVTGVVFVAVVLTALAGGAHVPSRLVVNRSPTPGAPSSATTPSVVTTPSSTTSPRPTPTTAVVVPREQPVVRESGDRYDDHAGRHGSGGSDG